MAGGYINDGEFTTEIPIIIPPSSISQLFQISPVSIITSTADYYTVIDNHDLEKLVITGGIL